MTSKSNIAWQPDSGPVLPNSTQERTDRPNNPRSANLDRPLPPLPPNSSFPKAYEIPNLRQQQHLDVPSITPVKHNRSVSNPFPSIFGGKRSEKKGIGRYDDDFDSSDGGGPAHSNIQRSMTGTTHNGMAASQPDRQPMTGKCITCDSTVRWPQGLKVFRCTTCLTVNDLELFEEAPATTLAGQSPHTTRPVPISLSRTKSLIDNCLNEYLQRQLYQRDDGRYPKPANETLSSSDEDPKESRSQQPSRDVFLDSAEHAALLKPRSPSDPRLTNIQSLSLGQDVFVEHSRPNLGSAEPSTRHPYAQPNSAEHFRKISNGTVPQNHPPPSLFKRLETYIAGCCTGCSTFNASFFTTRPAGDTTQKEDKNNQSKAQITASASSPQFELDSFISELDAKTLLLGDVVENGSWWTGRPQRKSSQTQPNRHRSPEKGHSNVGVKTPRINWMEVIEWYHLIVHAGADWQRRWTALRPSDNDPLRKHWEAVPLQKLKNQISESQLHLQRVLLKGTENMLKRPRQPLKTPEDCRFLLIVFANPLLVHSFQRSTLANQAASPPQHMREPSGSNRDDRNSPSKRRPVPMRKAGNLGHHSGIVKRVVGLLSNLTDELHQIMVSWMSRFSDTHFEKLVDIVSSFVTYRLTRQQDRPVKGQVNPTDGLIPSFTDSGIRHASQLHAALEIRPSGVSKQKGDGRPKLGNYSEDWQLRAAARVMALLFKANTGHTARKRDTSISREQRSQSAGLNAKFQAYSHGQIVPISTFYNTMLDHVDLVGDFEAWENTKTKFTFCQYPFFLSIWAKIHILEHDARRQMEVKAREAFFDSILGRRAVSQYLVLKVRRECLVEDSLKGVSETVGSGSSDIKKGLRIDFVGEEGIDAGGLRKEWFLLLVREIFDPHHGLFIYDEDSRYCYFNPHCFESSEQFFLVGVLLGLAIYNSTILDIAFPPFVFKKMLASAPPASDKLTSTPKIVHSYTLEDLAEYRPTLAKGLRQLLEFEGDVKEVFCRDFVVETERYGEVVQVPLCSNGQKRAVTNSNRREFVDLYIRYMLDSSVARQYEPFKRGFFTVCGGNALSLFRPEEIELLVRGSDEPLDIGSLRAVAAYENWPKTAGNPEDQPQALWFWETFEQARPADQRKMLGFITGSDRIPAMGATNLIIRLQMIRDKENEESGLEIERFPIARTCFNMLSLHRYRQKETLVTKLWTAVHESEGFGLK